jgi:hypothetical protein
MLQHSASPLDAYLPHEPKQEGQTSGPKREPAGGRRERAPELLRLGRQGEVDR